MDVIRVAFGHQSGVGKDTSARFLETQLRMKVPRLKIKKMSFADKLKDITYQLYSWTGIKRPIHYENYRNDRNKPIEALGGRTIVDLWVDVGEKMREVYPTTWVEYVTHNTDTKVVLTPDLRHPNEVQSMQAAGGLIYKIVNSRIPKREGKSIDDYLDDFTGWDGIIYNEGSLDDLATRMDNLSTELIQRFNLEQST